MRCDLLCLESSRGSGMCCCGLSQKLNCSSFLAVFEAVLSELVFDRMWRLLFIYRRLHLSREIFVLI